ncbi:MAG: ribonuclease Z [Bacteroidetes bacterium]|nr:ribonuclease Z [Bacteroidota bacterium]
MSFKLSILGCSSALPTSKRFSTAQVINMLERFFLIDCGEGTQIQMRKFKIPFGKINNIFISHLHGDHFFGLLGLISTFNLLNRESDLNIFCPADLENILNCQFNYFENNLNFKIIYHPLNFNIPEIIYEDNNLTVKSFPLRHKIPTCGFLFEEKQKPRNIIKEKIQHLNIPIKDIVKIKQGEDFVANNGEIYKNEDLTFPPSKPRSYAYCSDTAYYEDVIPVIKNVDLLYHEATFMNDMIERAKQTLHSTSVDAAKIAKKADVKQLIIGHFSARYKNIEPLLNEAKEIFPNTIAADDGMLVSVK